MPRPDASRHFLYAILALQNNFISREQLLAAFQAWIVDKSRPLVDLIQAHLDSDVHGLLGALADKHVAAHGNDADRSLAAALAASPARHDLARLADADVQASLSARIAPTSVSADGDPFATTDSVGLSTLAGSRFRVLRPHARGGLGEVLVAHDEELHREVALKQIRLEHAFHADSRSRFLLEAEVTGRLEHPGIVPVYSLGTYDDGRPFYAMRFIRGETLREAIERLHGVARSASNQAAQKRGRVDNLAFRQLLGRFAAVCQAIQYAHDRGILHRDLKPDNIMLGRYGETLVVDWGLAKVRGRGEAGALEEATLRPTSQSGSAETMPGAALGTPAFMSPEQAAGRLDRVDCGSDIYSLGATLYTVLTGRPPFEGVPVAAMLRKVEQGDFPRPRQLRPELSAALEAICLRAMALDPGRRYGSARALAEDIEHWLGDEPVSAWAEPWTARLRRVGRRHPRKVAGVAAALGVGLIALAVGVLWRQSERASADREEARRLAIAAGRLEAAEQRVAQALEQARGTRGDLHAQLARERGLWDLLNQPSRWEAMIKAARADVDRARAIAAQADAEINPALSRQIEALQAALAADAADLALAQRIEKIRTDKVVLVDKDFNYEQAARDYAAALLAAGLGVNADPSETVARRVRAAPIRHQLLAALCDWAWVTRTTDRELSGKLLEIARLADDDALRHQLLRHDLWQDREGALTLAAEIREDAHKLASLSPQLIEMVGRILPPRPRETWLRAAQKHLPTDFWINLELGNALSQQGKMADAVGFYRAALAIRGDSAAVYNNMGRALAESRQLAAAAEAYRAALDIAPEYALSWTNLGAALMDLREYEAAETALRQALKADPDFDKAWFNLGTALHHQGKLDAAIDAYREALGRQPSFAGTHWQLGLKLMEKGAFNEGLTHLKAGAALGTKLPGWRDRNNVPFWLDRCQKLIDLERQTPDLLRGGAKQAPDMLQAAEMCRTHGARYRTAVDLFQRAWAARPELARSVSRYNAACAAAHVAAGRAADAPGLDHKERSAYRALALEWLRAELAERKIDRNANLFVLARLVDELVHWRNDPDLVDLRGEAIAKLPGEEQPAWRAFWQDVAARLEHCDKLFTTATERGKLDGKTREAVHSITLKKNQSVVIDMTSPDLDSHVTLLDETGALVTLNDDRQPGTRDARIFYAAPRDAVYRVHASSFEQRGVGQYLLTVRRLAAEP